MCKADLCVRRYTVDGIWGNMSYSLYLPTSLLVLAQLIYYITNPSGHHGVDSVDTFAKSTN